MGERGPQRCPGAVGAEGRLGLRARGEMPWSGPGPMMHDPLDEEIWVREEDPVDTSPPRRGAGSGKPRHTVPAPVTEEIADAAGVRAGAKLAERLAEAVHAYDHDRYQDSLRILRPLARAVSTSPAVRELYGLTLYRMGRWREALEEFEQYRLLTDSLRPVSGDDGLPAGAAPAPRRRRIVGGAAPSLAQWRGRGRGTDRDGRLPGRPGDLRGAIRLLERDRAIKKPRVHHLREWYALADLFERAGDVTQARDLFRRVEAADPDLFDTHDRLRALR